MAEAVLNDKIVKVVQEESITLTLSLEEAEIVRSMAGHAHLFKSDFQDGASGVYDALANILGRGSKYRPTECEHNTVTWKAKR